MYKYNSLAKTHAHSTIRRADVHIYNSTAKSQQVTWVLQINLLRQILDTYLLSIDSKVIVVSHQDE